MGVELARLRALNAELHRGHVLRGAGVDPTAAENDNPIWPHCDALIWPHLITCAVSRGRAEGLESY